MKTQKIIPNLWFDHQGEEAADFYLSLFEDSEKGRAIRYPKAGYEIHQKPEGKVMTVDFRLEQLRFTALNGGPLFRFNPSVSFFVLSKTPEEVSRLWEQLIDGGEALMPLDQYPWSPRYGWLKDRFGLHWQLMQEESFQARDRIIPSLFFTGEVHGKAQRAMEYYTSIFKNSAIEAVETYSQEENPYAARMVKHARFRLEDQVFTAMDSGMENDFPFTEAVSLIIDCKDQQEIDYYWEKLSAGGDPAAQQCGWLKDRFGISWQVAPVSILSEMLANPDQDRVNRVMEAFMKMKKFEINKLEDAFAGEASI